MPRCSAALFSLLAILASHLLQCQAAEVTCYAPDGITIAPNDSYVPCNKLGIQQQGVYSSCCLLDGDPDTRDLCAQSGLCLRAGIVQREYCTDKEWKSPACVPVCTDPKSGGSANGTVELTPCTDGTFCCGRNNLTCCGTKYAVSVTTQSSVVVVQTATVTATPAEGPPVAALAGVGAGLGAAILALCGALFCLRRKHEAIKRKNAFLEHSASQVEPSLLSVSGRPLSFMPGSAAPTLTTPSTHVPSMQDFAAFKAFVTTYQAAAEGGSNPHRYSELDATTAAAARHLSRLSVQQVPIGYEGIPESSLEHEPHQLTQPPFGSPPNVPTRGT
ncbi:hypothetical protein GQ53DRAFT_829664 [Thozetella sp. PMI_491]|nr:hypothetical protein GQ53DRAFT_829664 [Thozetella sp. PMI_491]